MKIAKLKIKNFSELWPYLFLLLVSIAVLYPLWLGRFYAIGDMRDVFIPLEQFFHEELLAGRLPAWHPDVAWGFPVIAAAQIGFFYPPLLVSRWLPVSTYLPLTLFLHTLALLVGTYTLARSYRVGISAALLGAVSFGLSAFVWQHLTHLNIFLAIAWLPWQLAWVRRIAINRDGSRQQWAALALLLAAPFLIGQFQIPLFLAMLSLALLWHERHVARRGVTGVLRMSVLLAVAVFLLAAVQLLSTLELLQFSSRAGGGDFDIVRANQHSWPLYHFPTFLFPRFFGSDDTYWGKRLEIEYGVFIGTLPFCIALWQGITSFRRPPRALRSPSRFWFIVAGVGLLLALGSLSPIRLVGLEPSLWYFSAPARWLLLCSLGLSLLTAFGLDSLLKNPAPFERVLRILGVGITLFVGLINGLLFLTPGAAMKVWQWGQSLLPGGTSVSSDYYVSKGAQLVASFTTSSVSLASFYTYLPLAAIGMALLFYRHRFWATTIIGMTVLELLVIAARTTPTLPWLDIVTAPPSVSHLPDAVRAKQARVAGFSPGGDTGAYFTNPESRADDTARAQQRELLLPLMHAQFGIPGIAWPASLDLRSHGQLRQGLADNEGRANLDAAADLNIGVVLVASQLPQPESISPPIALGANNLYVVAARPRAEVLESDRANRVLGEISYKETAPDRVVLEVVSPKDGLLVIRDTMYPGWQATIDGLPVSMGTYQGAFRSLPLPAGTHEVIMRFVPRSLYLGLALSSLALLGTLIFLAAPRMLGLRYEK